MAQHVDPNRWRGTVRGRLLVVALLLLGWVLAVQVRLVLVQVHQRDHWVQKAKRQQQRDIELPARRGEIVDRNGELLATSVEVEQLGIDPKRAIEDGKHAGHARAAVATICAALGDCSPEEVRELTEKFDPEAQYLRVRDRLDPQQAKRLRDLKLRWVSFLSRPWRFYPNREMAAHVLGAVSADSQGLAGLEQKYDKRYLRGRPARQRVVRTPGGSALSRVGDPPIPGDTLELTIDRYLQFEVEQILRAAVAEHAASAGCAVMLGTDSGEILALASWPTFNPNVRYSESSEEQKRNRVIQDAYDPGSTFKVVTAAAALEQKVIRPDDIVHTGNGTKRLAGYTIRDVHAYGAMSFREVITKSSNVGAAIVGERLGRERLGRYVSSMGFGRKLLPDLPGENAGLVYPAATWPEITVATIAYGYGLTATPLQLAAAVSAIGNGGELVQPRILRARIRNNTRIIEPRRVLGRALLPETAAQLTQIMEGVTVKGGTATAAAIDGYTVAGKTGTAQKQEGKGYNRSAHRGSFVGFVPSRNPVVTIFVMLDTPRRGGYYGGAVAAPAFRKMAEAALRHLAVGPTINPPPAVLVERQAPRSALPVAGPAVPLTIVPTRPLNAGELLLPELRGLSGRAAVQALSRLGLSARIVGDGVVTAQEPLPGTAMEPGSSCRLWLARAVPIAPSGTRP